MQRRNFLKIGGLGSISAGLIHSFLTGSLAENPVDEKNLSLMCEPTTADILGPYYRSNSPLRSDIVPEEDNDENTVYMSGKVITNDCSPVEGASVELWQADGASEYYMLAPDFRYRGTFITNSDGSYFFNTVVPGHYLNGSQYRPAHLHFRVTKQGFRSIITQIYFEGDEFIPIDPWASAPAASLRIIPLVEVNTGEHKYELNFDFSLDIITSTEPEVPAFAANIKYNNPFVSSINIQTNTDDLIIHAAEILDIHGKLILSKYRLNDQSLSFKTDALRSGLYFLRLKTSQGIGVFRIVKTD
ncbi:MAG: T9SS type A sorting domain-containing protein [Saprospiraceae bacterium]|nr:T9SS type A sorting domain-containing protein [Saprospiraceae bacterium]